MKDKEKTSLILEALIKNNTAWGRSRHNILFPELRLGSGYCGVAQRRIDLFMIDSGAGNVTTAFEIKVSRGDFKHDLDNDLKQRGARLYSNYFYYVTPPGLVKTEEIPVWAGLLEIDIEKYKADKTWYTPREIVPAPLHSKAMPSWGLICSMIRHINKDAGQQRVADLNEEVRLLQNKLNRAESLLGKIARGEESEYRTWELMEYKAKK